MGHLPMNGPAERRAAFAALVRAHLADPLHLPLVVELIQAGLVYGRHDLGSFGALKDGVDGDPGERTVSAFITAMSDGQRLADALAGVAPALIADEARQRVLAAGIAAVAPRLMGSEIAEWAEHLSEAAARWGIDTRGRLAMWLAQLAHESGGFTRLEESLRYRSADRLMEVWPSRFRSRAQALPYADNPEGLANLVYANRMGNDRPGDGWKYRGRGLPMLTGAANYREAARATGIPIDREPDLAAVPEHSAQIAGWYWQRHGCDRYADAGDIEGCRRAWNGALVGIVDVRRLWTAAKAALGVAS